MGQGVSQGGGSIPTLASRVPPPESIHRHRREWHALSTFQNQPDAQASDS